jgi:hypothetical protein
MTTLSSLKKLPATERDSYIAALIRSFTPSPTDVRDDVELSRDIYQKAEKELLSKLHLTSLEAPHARTAALRFLTGALKQTAVPTSDVRNVRERVGGKGALPLHLYDVAFGQNFVDLNETLGVSKDAVLAVIRSADGVEHFVPDEVTQSGVDPTTILVKHFFGADPYTLIVIAMREGAKLRIDRAWKSFFSEVPTEPLAKPVDFLHAFVEVFGVPLRIGDTEAKFVAYEIFPLSPTSGRNMIEVLNGGQQHRFDARFNYRASAYSLAVTLAFAIDVECYASSLAKHGVSFSRDLTDIGHRAVYISGHHAGKSKVVARSKT